MNKKIILVLIMIIVSVSIIGCKNSDKRHDLTTDVDSFFVSSETNVSSITLQEKKESKTEILSSKTGDNSTQAQNSGDASTPEEETPDKASAGDSTTDIPQKPYDNSGDEGGIDLPIDLF